jgi:phage-related protein
LYVSNFNGITIILNTALKIISQNLDLVVRLGNFAQILVIRLETFKRNISVYRNYFWDFYNAQSKEVQDKMDWVIGLIRSLQVVPRKYFDHITGTDGLFEIRIQLGSNIYRIFCFFDEGNLVILLNGFQKRTQKTPSKEIKKAERLKKEYYEENSSK